MILSPIYIPLMGKEVLDVGGCRHVKPGQAPRDVNIVSTIMEVYSSVVRVRRYQDSGLICYIGSSRY